LGQNPCRLLVHRNGGLFHLVYSKLAEVRKMKIFEPSLKFNGALQPRASTRRIIVHHTASPDVPAATIHRWHISRGWSGIGYHFVIRANGSIERGRPEHTRGAHAPEANTDSIGIVLAGDFTKTKPTEEQIQALVELVQYLREKYGNIPVQRHSDVSATACPGKLFPWKEFQRRLVGGENVASQQDKNQPSPWAKEAWEWAKKEGITDGTRPKDALTREEMVTMLHRYHKKVAQK